MTISFYGLKINVVYIAEHHKGFAQVTCHKQQAEKAVRLLTEKGVRTKVRHFSKLSTFVIYDEIRIDFRFSQQNDSPVIRPASKPRSRRGSRRNH